MTNLFTHRPICAWIYTWVYANICHVTHIREVFSFNLHMETVETLHISHTTQTQKRMGLVSRRWCCHGLWFKRNLPQMVYHSFNTPISMFKVSFCFVTEIWCSPCIRFQLTRPSVPSLFQHRLRGSLSSRFLSYIHKVWVVWSENCPLHWFRVSFTEETFLHVFLFCTTVANKNHTIDLYIMPRLRTPVTSCFKAYMMRMKKLLTVVIQKAFYPSPLAISSEGSSSRVYQLL